MKLIKIPNHNGYYCSEYGDIFSLKRKILNKLKLFNRDRQGRLAVNLSHDGKYKMYSVHRIVALSWIGTPPTQKHFVMHLDNNPSNNSVKNLKYGLAAENSHHMVYCNRQARGERINGSKLNASMVIALRSRMRSGELPSRIAKEVGMSLTNICDIKKRKIWRHI